MQDKSFLQMAENWKQIIDFGPRPMGSLAAEQCAGYLRGEMDNITENSYLESFETEAWDVEDWDLEVCSPNGRKLESFLFLGSGAEPEGFEGGILFAGYNRIWNMYVWEKYAVVDEEGEIKAYITVRGNGKAIPQMLFTGKSTLPHFLVGQEEAEFFRTAEKNQVKVKGYARAGIRKGAVCRNVIGILHPEKKKRVLLCAHYDTVYTTPGAYDNSSGAAVILEVGRRLGKENCRTSVELMLTDGEEYNLVGARHHCEAGTPVDMVLNVDGVGRERILEVWSGPEPFERQIRTYLGQSKEDFTPVFKSPPPPGSDHAPYYEKGIPVCMLTFNDQGILHSALDVYEENKLDNMEVMVRMVMEMLRYFNVIE